MNLDKLKQDHVSILSSIAELRKQMQSGIAENAEGMVKAMAAMGSTIKQHLAVEDRLLYPALANSLVADQARIGQAFQNEMGGIAVKYLEFEQRWTRAADIAAHPQAFKAHADGVFMALQQRIQRENLELYPVAERA